MNERILKMALEAGFHVDEHDEIEYFAELIVKECAHVGFNTAYPEKGVDVMVAIKEHFGVK